VADRGLALDSARGRWALTASVLGSGVALLDTTVVNVALPALGRDLGADLAGLQWTVNGYVLSLASLILLGGALGDRFGRRRVFVVGTVWFAVASLLCGLAPGTRTLVAARLLQGAGAALLTPASLALLHAGFRREDRARAVGAWAGLTGIAAAVGPLVGGLLVEVSWRLVFLINLPLCAVVVVLAVRAVPESADEQAARRLDVPGALLCAAGLGGLTWALVGAGDRGASGTVVAAGAAGSAALLAFVVVERRSRAPLLPVQLFASRQFTAANLVTGAVYAALSGVLFLLVLHLQVVGGFSPLAAGTALLPITAAMVLLSSRAGAMASRVGPRLPMTAGPVVCACGTLLMLRIGPEPSYLRDVLPAVTVFGLGLAATVAPLTAAVLGAAADRHAGVASGVNNAVARTAGLLAVAALPLAAGLSGDDHRDPPAFDDGFRTAVLLAAGLLAAGGALSAATVRDPAIAREEGGRHPSG
jgi:EmrB/QacA subfamily drug resistance transporter